MTPMAAVVEPRGACGAGGEFAVPPDLEAHEPPEARGLPRDQVRLMVTDRRVDAIMHARFADLPLSPERIFDRLGG